MDRIIEISSVFVDLFNRSAGNPTTASIPVQLQETTEDYIQKILTACCSQQGSGIPGFQSGSTVGSSGLRVNEFKPNLDWFNCKKPLLFGKHLKGKLVLLDFFTYCCVNCLHILPILHSLQKRFTCEDGLVIIGVHSPKFPNEQLSVNVQHAIEKYSIEHCVVNDTDGTMWNDLAICCWPTLVLIGPNGEPMLVVQGEEFHSQLLPTFIETALQILRQASMISSHDIPEIIPGSTTLTQLLTVNEQSVATKQFLLYPGKVSAYTRKLKIRKNNDVENTTETNINYHNRGKILVAIADSGHHRILICTLNGRVKHVIGGGGIGLSPSTTKFGFKDGRFIEALFHSPQGICFQNSRTLFVCDTENHAIRMIDLKEMCVKTVAGKGKKGSDKYGGKLWNSQILNTPWDVVYYKRKAHAQYQQQYTPQPYTPQQNYQQQQQQSNPLPTPSPVRCLLIAMAGLHQIWALYLDKTSTSTCSTGMKSKWCSKGLCTMIAGTGKEENRNNSYNGQRASFSQPSGLCLSKPVSRNGHGGTDPSLYIADSESSSIRRMYLDSMGKYRVLNVAGGSPDPTDLFSYGDIDGGAGANSRLQHPMDVAWNFKRNILYVADSYNHKIKYVTGLSDNPKLHHYNGGGNPSPGGTGSIGGVVHTLPLPVKLNEPNGLHFIENPQDKSSLLLIADTNNHTIWVYNFDTYVIKKLQLEFPKILESSPSNVVGTAQIILNRRTGGQLMLRGRINLGCNPSTDGSQHPEEQPQLHWTLQLPDSNWESKEIKSNTSISAVSGVAADFKYLIRVPKQELEEDKNDENNDNSNSRDFGANRRWSDKYNPDFTYDSDENSEDESDNDEEVVILRCQTSVCQDGDKCVPIEFDFIVRVRYGDEENTPQAADTYFPYTIPYGSSTNNLLPISSFGVDFSSSNTSSLNNVDPSIEP